MDVVAIDFETANGNANSACQLAAVVVRNSETVEEYCWLIRPPRLYFSPRNIAVHGIHPADVVNAPNMERIWMELSKVIDGQVLVAHNARFDVGVLVASLAAHDLACPDIEFTCTRLLARCAWPGRSRYGLKPLGDWLGVQFRHHDALEDARCCAKIALSVERSQDLQDLAQLEAKLRITRGSYRKSMITSPGRVGRRNASNARAVRVSTDRWGFPDPKAKIGNVDPAAILTAARDRKPLSGKRIVLLGPLRGLDWNQSCALIRDLGGQCQKAINTDTDYVVACGTSLDDASQIVCGSLAKQEELSSTGKIGGIRLLSERQFRALLPAGKASVRW